jgi:photosystem II stability/assembly factor-like uncharacterized protein
MILTASGVERTLPKSTALERHLPSSSLKRRHAEEHANNSRYAVHPVLFAIWLVVSLCFPSLAVPGGLYDDLFSVTFPTENDGWACGRWGTVLHTGDGGRSWTRQASGTDNTLSSIHFVDAHTGWAVGNMGTILHTEDGGKTWGHQQSPVPLYLMGVHGVSPRKGFIVTERTTILSTDDGGKTWKTQFSDLDYVLHAVSFADPLHGWAAGEYGYIYHTENGGRTWEKQAGEFKISAETGDIVGGNYLFSVVAIDAMTAWAVGIDGYVTRTTDGGKTWEAVKTDLPKVHLFGIAVNRAGAIVIGGNGIMASSSDGRTFTPLPLTPPVHYGWLYGLTTRGSDFVAVGLRGAIYLSDSTTGKRVAY